MLQHVSISFLLETLILRCVHLPRFLYPLSQRWTQGCLPPFGHREWCCWERGLANMFASPRPVPLRLYPVVEVH